MAKPAQLVEEYALRASAIIPFWVRVSLQRHWSRLLKGLRPAFKPAYSVFGFIVGRLAVLASPKLPADDAYFGGSSSINFSLSLQMNELEINLFPFVLSY
jgi:hypothetical protein